MHITNFKVGHIFKLDTLIFQNEECKFERFKLRQQSVHILNKLRFNMIQMNASNLWIFNDDTRDERTVLIRLFHGNMLQMWHVIVEVGKFTLAQ